jgi:hypothetical protein
MINPNKYIKVVAKVVHINHWLGDARLDNGLTVDIGRSNKLAVHVGDTVKAEVNYRIMSESYYGPVIKNLSAGK